MTSESLVFYHKRLRLIRGSVDLRSYMVSILSKYFTVAQAADGIDALESIYRNPPSAVVTDVMMPRLDGRGLLKAVRDGTSR